MHPEDPIWRQAIPDAAEIETPLGAPDPLAEEALSPVPNLIHRYPDRVVLLVSNQCAMYCRFCMRKRRVGQPATDPHRRDSRSGCGLYRQGNPCAGSNSFRRRSVFAGHRRDRRDPHRLTQTSPCENPPHPFPDPVHAAAANHAAAGRYAEKISAALMSTPISITPGKSPRLPPPPAPGWRMPAFRSETRRFYSKASMMRRAS